MFVNFGTRFAVLREVCSGMDKTGAIEEKSLQSCVYHEMGIVLIRIGLKW